jgi:hypothetical protein
MTVELSVFAGRQGVCSGLDRLVAGTFNVDMKKYKVTFGAEVAIFAQRSARL